MRQCRRLDAQSFGKFQNGGDQRVDLERSSGLDILTGRGLVPDNRGSAVDALFDGNAEPHADGLSDTLHLGHDGMDEGAAFRIIADGIQRRAGQRRDRVE